MLCNTPKRYRKKTTLALGSWSRSLMTEKGTYINKASHFLSKWKYREQSTSFYTMSTVHSHSSRHECTQKSFTEFNS